MAWKLGRSKAVPQEPAPDAAEQEPPEAVVNGFFRGRERVISGWVLDLADSSHKHDVDIYIAGEKVGTARADRFDEMVQSQHGGDGNYGFAFYYSGQIDEEGVEASAIDSESGSELRSKQPMVSESVRTGPPLTIEKIRIGSSVELLGRVGAYPWNEVKLELWRNGERIVSSIPITGISEIEGLFSARLEGEALEALLGSCVEIALPGLKEAGMAVMLERAPLIPVISQQEDELRLELRGEFEQSGAIPVTVRFLAEDGSAVEERLKMASRAASVHRPAGFRALEGSFEIVIGGVVVPSRLEWPLLRDVRFKTLGTAQSPWTVSDASEVESGFFAFPAALTDEHQLSGHVAHLWQDSDNTPLRLSQTMDEAPAAGQAISVTAFVRAPKRAELAARLRDESGAIARAKTTSKTNSGWTKLRVNLPSDHEIKGKLSFEVEASGPGVTEMEVTFGGSRQPKASDGEYFGSDLLANGDFHGWPYGATTLTHSVRGEAAAGWRIFNRRNSSPVFTRALMDPADGALGLAVAAGQVSEYLRIEADFAPGEIAGSPLCLRFRAGVPASARQLLANSHEAIPQFAVVDRIYLVRRTQTTSADSFDQRNDVVTIFARKLPISTDIERFTYEVPAIPEPDDPDPKGGEDIDVSYHLAFDFRHPTVIALFDVEVLADYAAADQPESAPLKVEDRNIELQIQTLEAVAHWHSSTPVRLALKNEEREIAPLKWSAGNAREPVTIVIPVFNALPETLDCLASLARSSTVPILVNLIDDGSDQPVREALVDYASDKPWVQVHRFPRNRGYTFASDFGIREARTEWVVLLNSDTIVTRGWLEGMLDCARSDPAIAFVGPLSNAASYQSVPELYDASNKWKINRLPPGVTPDDMAEIVRGVSHHAFPEVPILNGFCTLMKRSAFVELGGLNATAFPAGYGEENDLCFRASKAGYKLAVADDVYVYHVKSASFGTARRQELTKAGNQALARLHPDVDIPALTTAFRDTPALVAVRKGVAAELSKLHAPPEAESADAAATADPAEAGNDDREPQLQKA